MYLDELYVACAWAWGLGEARETGEEEVRMDGAFLCVTGRLLTEKDMDSFRASPRPPSICPRLADALSC